MTQTLIIYNFDGRDILVIKPKTESVQQSQNATAMIIGPIVSSEEPRFVVMKPDWETSKESKDCIFKVSLRNKRRLIVRKLIITSNGAVNSETILDIMTPNLTIMKQKLNLDSGITYNYTAHIIRSFAVSSTKRLYILKDGSVMTSLPENSSLVDCEVDAVEGDWYTHTHKYYNIFPKEPSQSGQYNDIIPMELSNLLSFNLYASLVYIHHSYYFDQIKWCKIHNFDVYSIKAEPNSYGRRNYNSVVYVGYSKADTELKHVVGIISCSSQI